MDPMVAPLGKFVGWVVSIYFALVITVVPSLNQGDDVTAAVGFAMVFLIFVVAPVVAGVAMAVRKGRRGRSPLSLQS